MKRPWPTVNVVCLDDGFTRNVQHGFGETTHYTAVAFYIPGVGFKMGLLTDDQISKSIVRAGHQTETPSVAPWILRVAAHLAGWPWLYAKIEKWRGRR